MITDIRSSKKTSRTKDMMSLVTLHIPPTAINKANDSFIGFERAKDIVGLTFISNLTSLNPAYGRMCKTYMIGANRERTSAILYYNEGTTMKMATFEFEVTDHGICIYNYESIRSLNMAMTTEFVPNFQIDKIEVFVRERT